MRSRMLEERVMRNDAEEEEVADKNWKHPTKH